MKKNYFITVFLALVTSGSIFCQDIVTLKKSDEGKSKISEKYRNDAVNTEFNSPGETASINPESVDMNIQYNKGSQELFHPESSLNGYGFCLYEKSSLLTDDKPNRVGIYLNPLGFIQFGPMLGTEITLNSRIIIDGHVRFSSAGVLMYIITKSDDGISPYKISGLGAGGGLKFFQPSRIGGFYAGFLMEYGWQTQYYEKNEPWVWQEESKYIVAAADIGYKFRFTGGFYMNTGAILGTAIVTNDIWYYTNSYYQDVSIHDNGGNLKPFGMLELSFGVEF